MKRLLIPVLITMIMTAIGFASDYSRDSLMEALRKVQTPEAANEIFTEYLQKTPDLDFANEIHRMWSSNDPEAAAKGLEAMRGDPQYAGRIVYFEGAAIGNLLERIDYCRKRISEKPENFEPYALMFDTYTDVLFMNQLDDGRSGTDEPSAETIAALDKGFSPDNEKMARVRDWKNQGQYVEMALKYMTYYGFYKGHYDDALKFAKEGETLNADWVDYSHMAVAAVRLKQLELAREYVSKYADVWIKRGAVTEDRRKDMMDSVLMYALVTGGAYDEAVAELTSREGALENPDSLYNLACLYSRKGDVEKAFETLNTAIDKGFNDTALFDTDTDLESLRADPRWNGLKARIKEAWDRGESERMKAAVAQKIEKEAPGWELKDPDGKVYRLSDYAGKKVVILDFWATWCGPCMMAMPKLHEWTGKNKTDAIEVFSINTWERQPENARKMFAEKKYSMTLLMNGDETGKAYGLQGIPYICVIDKTGKIRYEMKGFSPELEQNLTYWVQDLLK